MINTFRMSSRLGLLHTPQRQTTLNTGVEDGPRAVLSQELADELALAITDFRYSSPDDVRADQYYDVFAKEATEAKRVLRKVLAQTQSTSPTSVVVGGDHSVALAHVAALLEISAEPEHTGIVMMDSHADLNLRSSSPTGNIHGMWMRPLVDHFDVAELDLLVEHKIPANHLFYIGHLDLDPAEQDFLADHKIHTLSVEELRARPEESLQIFSKWTARFSHVHLSIDIDGFDQQIAPATGIPCQDGLLLEDVEQLLLQVKKLRRWSLDLVEVNPKKEGAAKTVELAQHLLRYLLSKEELET